jgi:hypothetical protein
MSKYVSYIIFQGYLTYFGVWIGATFSTAASHRNISNFAAGEASSVGPGKVRSVSDGGLGRRVYLLHDMF